MKLYLKIWIVQLAGISLLLLKYPIIHSLMGDLDTWECTALYENIHFYLTSGTNYQANYPFHHPVYHTDPVFLAATIYQISRIFFDSIYVAWFVVFLSIFSLNAVSFSFFLRQFNKDVKVAAITGFLFSVTAYFWCNLDMLNGLLIAPSLLSFGFLFRCMEGKRDSDLILSMFFWGLQIYASTYFFIFSSIVFSVILLLHGRTIISNFSFKTSVAGIIWLFAVIAPMVWMFVIEPAGVASPSQVNPMSGIYFHSMKPHEFFESYKNHLNFFYAHQKSSSHYFEVMHFVFPGFAVLILSVVYLILIRKQTFWIYTLLLTGLIISAGPLYKAETHEIRLPWFYLIKTIPFLQSLHHISRGAVYMSLAGFLMTGLLLSKIKNSSFKYVLFALAGLIFLENFSFHLPTYKSDKIIAQNQRWTDLFEIKQGSIVMNYPSRLDIKDDKFYMQMRREYIYMYWQNYLRANVTNGYYFSLNDDEKKIRDSTFQIPTRERLTFLKNNLKLNYILVHKVLVYDDIDSAQINALQQMKELKTEYEDSVVVLYRL